jgi:hypothetical protein
VHEWPTRCSRAPRGYAIVTKENCPHLPQYASHRLELEAQEQPQEAEAFRTQQMATYTAHSQHLMAPESSNRVLGYRPQMYGASCEVRTEFIYVM